MIRIMAKRGRKPGKNVITRSVTFTKPHIAFIDSDRKQQGRSRGKYLGALVQQEIERKGQG